LVWRWHSLQLARLVWRLVWVWCWRAWHLYIWGAVPGALDRLGLQAGARCGSRGLLVFQSGALALIVARLDR